MESGQLKKEKPNTCADALELLAPAGSFAAAKAVIHAGADAVYLGGESFGARAYAQNLTKGELLEVIDYVHLHGRKIYLTVNTLLKQAEMEELYGYLLPFYEQGLDAVIIQDYGVMQHIRRWFPGLAVHISTQMSVADAHGAAYLKHMGAARVVPARELSLEEIQNIHRQVDIEIECFVHGALCYCYSGQCLFSSILGGRSGNRGRCAQPCRLPYTVLDESRRRLSGKECYPLSPKDLCTLGQIPDLVQAGVCSFKIEGRMKSAEYAAGVTDVYRRYIDAYLRYGTAAPQKRDLEYLAETGSRSGFTSGYYYRHNGPEMLTLDHPAYEKKDHGFLQHIHETYVEKEQELFIAAAAFLKKDRPAAFTVEDIRSGTCGFAQDETVQAAKKQPLSCETVQQQLSKTGNTPYKIKSMDITMDDHIFLPKQILNRLRRNALDDLTQRITSSYRRKAPKILQRDGNIHVNVIVQKEPGAKESLFTAAIEREDQLQAVINHDFISRVYLDSSMYPREGFVQKLAKHINMAKASGRQAYYILPAVLRMKTVRFYQQHFKEMEQAGIDGYLVRNQDGLGFLNEQGIEKSRCVLDHSLYTWSDDTKAYYAAQGWIYDTAAVELNKRELAARNNTASELIIYGYLPLMTSAQCIWKTFRQCSGRQRICYLKDRYAKEFPVKNNCMECYSTIYNTQPLSLIQLSDELLRLHPSAYRLHFTIETARETDKILDCARRAFLEHDAFDMTAVIGAYTNGHFKRGVE